MILSNWKTEKIEKLFDLGRGRVISDEEIKKSPGPYPVFSSQTENNGCFGNVNFYEFEGEYITWTTDGANTGTVFFRDGKFNCTNVCGTLKAKNSNEIDTKLFSYLISREAYKHVAIVGNNKLMNNVMGKIKVHYPQDITEQRKIASILTKVDDAIQAVKNTIEKAERLKKSLMQNLLTGKLKPDGTWRSEDEFDITLMKHLKMKGLQKIKNFRKPINWELIELNDIADFKYGKGLSEGERINGKYPVYGSNGIIGFHNNFLIQGPGIIVGRKGTVGSVFWSDKEFFPIDTAFYVELKNNYINYRWLFYALIWLELNRLNSATGVPGLSRLDAISLFL